MSFSPLFSLPSRTRTILSWISNEVLVYSSSLWISSLCFSTFHFFLYLLHFTFISLFSPFCFLIFWGFRHCLPLHSTPYCGAWVGHQHLQVSPPPYAWAWAWAHFPTSCPTTGVHFCSSPPEEGEAEFWFAVCVSSMLASNLFVYISIFSDRNFCMYSCFYFSSCMFRVPKESPIRVLFADMFPTPSTTFELPSYAAKLAHHFAKAPSPPPTRTHPFNNLVLDCLDIEAKQGVDSNRHDSPSCWLGLVGLVTQVRMLYFYLNFFEFICFISIYLLQIPILFESACWY